MKNKKSLFLILLAVVIAIAFPVYSRLTTVDPETAQTTERITFFNEAEQADGTDTETTENMYAPPEETATTAKQATEKTTEKVTEKATTKATTKTTTKTTTKSGRISKDGTYCSKDEVALYIHTYGRLPSNYITKKEAQNKGWSGGSVEAYAPGKCIGGDKFGNYEGLLPKANGRQYYECDIDTLGKSSRGAKRIIYSNDGLIYYTSDHYESFTQLY